MVKGNPFNYSGSKARYYNEISKNLPKGLSEMKMLDLFVGGGDFSYHFRPKSLTVNDVNKPLLSMHKGFLDHIKGGGNGGTLKDYIKTLSSGFGMDKWNEGAFQKVKDLYNSGDKSWENLYLLTCTSNSNYLRFNGKGAFNVKFGKRYFNPSMQSKLEEYGNNLVELKDNLTIMCEDFRKIDFEDYDFIVLDPPYQNTTAVYNDCSNSKWGLKEEYALYRKLDKFKGKFILTNQLYSKGEENYILKEWIDSRKDLHIECLNSDSYKNCNYQREQGMTVELLIMNY